MLNQILTNGEPVRLAEYIATRYSLIMSVKDSQALLSRAKKCGLLESISGDYTDCVADLWLNTRLREMGYFHSHDIGHPAIPDGLITAIFHFWSWDEERFGPKPAYKPGEFTPARSKIFNNTSRKPVPIDRTALAVAPMD